MSVTHIVIAERRWEGKMEHKNYDIETIMELLSHANMESIRLRKMTTTSFLVEIVFSMNYLMDGGEE